MAILKCKMCGGNIEFAAGATVGVCDSCGTKQTLPRMDDDRRSALLDRANHFRRNGEFDKAAALYEQLISEGTDDAEIYWSLVLCRYGIQYVKDPKTRRQVPTVNRAQYTPVSADADYKAALSHADGAQRELYQAEAAEIDAIQKGILEVSQKEQPFDVFICYKETDANGRRTQDSVLANELYYELTDKGYKVFFARITLEDKLGSAYEPYIFAALHSAKVMVVLGTRPEYFNAVWVKNEWSRYLALIKQGEKKLLIPAYRDMDPYDLPEEFATLQAQDMSKLGFVQDLVRGIGKVTEKSAPKPAAATEIHVGGDVSAENLVERGYFALEFGEWQNADALFEQALNADMRQARAYVGKMLAELQVPSAEKLAAGTIAFEENKNYQKALRVADAAYAAELRALAEKTKENRKRSAQEKAYAKAVDMAEAAKRDKNTADLLTAAQAFDEIGDYRDAAEQAKTCREAAQAIRYEKAAAIPLDSAENYDRAVSLYRKAGNYRDAAEKAAVLEQEKPAFVQYRDACKLMTGDVINNYRAALEKFQKITGFRDAAEKAIACRKTIEALEYRAEQARLEKARKAELARIQAEKRRQILRKTMFIGIPSFVVTLTLIILTITVFVPTAKYNKAKKLIAAGDEATAYATLASLPADYKDRSALMVDLLQTGKITAIGAEDFKNCKDLKNITIPDSVKTIAEGAFSGCSSLQSITLSFVGGEADITANNANQYPFGYIFGTNSYTGGEATKQTYYSNSLASTTSATYYIPSSLKSVTVTDGNIPCGAFSGCSTLARVTIPDSATSIEEYAFSDCSTLMRITIPDSVTSIGNGAFEECTSLTSVTFGANSKLTSIGNSAFYNCISLTSIEIPASVTSIGSSAFRGCTSLASIEIPASVTSIGYYAFNDCTSLTSIEIPASVTSIGYATFYGCTSLTSIEIPANVTSIGGAAFYGCTSLTSVTFGANSKLTDIEGSAFHYCTSLTSIEIPASVTSIGVQAFYGCTSLTSIEIPASVASIGQYAFWRCNSLTSVTFANTSGWYITIMPNATGGTNMTVTDPSANATNLKSTCSADYWYRK